MEVSDKVDAVSGKVEVLEGLENLLTLVLHLDVVIFTHPDGFLVDEVQTGDHYDRLVALRQEKRRGGGMRGK